LVFANALIKSISWWLSSNVHSLVHPLNATVSLENIEDNSLWITILRSFVKNIVGLEKA